MLTITRNASQLSITCNDEDGELATFVLSDESTERTISRTAGCVAHLTGLSKDQVLSMMENA